MKLTRMAAAAGLLLAAGVGTVVVAAPASAYPDGTIATATINATVFNRGGTATVNVKDATPGGVLTMIFQSTPVVLSTGAVVGNDSTGVISGNIPANATLGAHTITVNSTKGESFKFAVTVVAKGGGNDNGNGGGNGNGNGNGGGLANTGAAVTGIGVLGGILVAGGVFFVVAGRRRTAANQTPTV